MNSKLKKAILAVVILLVGYVGSYIPVRIIRTDKNEKSGERCVVFPNGTLAAIYRPLSSIDTAITGTHSCVGPLEAAAPEPGEQ